MERFEYHITSHDAETFSKMGFLCSTDGACKLEDLPAGEATALLNILNEQGRQGWELIQILFGNDNITAFWKRRISS
jgi:hypothetical protein